MFFIEGLIIIWQFYHHLKSPIFFLSSARAYTDLCSSRAAKKLAEQSLADTEAALERIFSACPDVDVVELSVMEPDREGDRRIMFGAVQRNEFQQWHPLSTNMRLRLVGLHFRMVDDHMDPLPPERMKADVSSPPIGGGSDNETKAH